MSGKRPMIKLRIGKKKSKDALPEPKTSAAAAAASSSAPAAGASGPGSRTLNRRLRPVPETGIWSYDTILRISEAATPNKIADALTQAELHIPLQPLSRPRTLAIQTGPDKGVFELMARFYPLLNDGSPDPVAASSSAGALSASSLMHSPSAAGAVSTPKPTAAPAERSSSKRSISSSGNRFTELNHAAKSTEPDLTSSSLISPGQACRGSQIGRHQWTMLAQINLRLATRVGAFLEREARLAVASSSSSSSSSSDGHSESSVAIGDIVLRADEADESSSSTMHTYPVPPDGSRLESATIADSYLIVSHGDRMFWSIADGIGHGVKPRHAAMAALSAFWFSVEAELSDVSKQPDNQTQRILDLLVRSVFQAQNMVCAIGSDHTTLLGGVLVRTQTSKKNPWPWMFLGTGVGDCKCYRWSKATGLCEEITLDPPAKHMRDPGGFLGFESPVTAVSTYICPLDEGDVVLAMSDGVHDNLDPATLKISPRYFGFMLDDWQDLEDEEPEKTRDVKRQFRQRRLEQLLGAYSSSVSTKEIVQKIIDYTIGTTALLRSAEEKGMLLQTQWASLPPEEAMALKREIINLQRTAPGKYDHCTVFAIQVGSRPTSASASSATSSASTSAARASST